MSIATELANRATRTQAQTVKALNAIPGVDAGPLDVVAHDPCWVNPGHGPGTCVFRGTDGACRACTIDHVLKSLLVADPFAIDVLL